MVCQSSHLQQFRYFQRVQFFPVDIFRLLHFRIKKKHTCTVLFASFCVTFVESIHCSSVL